MTNDCRFSPCRRYRYTLEHVIDDVLAIKPRRVMWVGLNPSTADENVLDPTLRRIRRYSLEWGFTSFIMTNLFAFRSTDPRKMLEQADPVGPLNNVYLKMTALKCELIVACWGTHGVHQDRDRQVSTLLSTSHAPIVCLGVNSNGTPKHPLYLKAGAQRVPYYL